MMGFERSDDYQPLFWVQGRPVHVTTLLVILHTFSLVACCLISGLTGANPWEAMAFSSDAVLHHGKLWEIVTYVFVQTPSLWFVVNMFFLFMWGREVERFFGRTTFIALYAGLAAVTPVVLLTRGLLSGLNQAAVFPGPSTVHFGVFLIFATIYPSVQFFFGIPCKWIAYALVAIAALQCFAFRLVNDGLILAGTVAAAYYGARYASMGSEAFAVLGSFREMLPRKKVVSAPRVQVRARRALDSHAGGDAYRSSDVHESIDPLLDKINKHGLGSLTNSERAVLEKARVSLLRKDRGD